MKAGRILLTIFCMLPIVVYAQKNIVSRIILIGDAGEYSKRQNGVILDAAEKILKGKTSVFYLGDNVYPTGMGLPGSKEEDSTKKILQSQYQPMRKNGAPVYFVPGNHDWDRMGPKGLAKIKRQWEYLNEQKDTLLKEIPANGCPDPTEVQVSKDMVVIAFDSEWWLYLYNKDNPDADCDCKTNGEIVNRFRELLYKNRNKIIILADHHPFESYGHHGGTYVWQDYVFPLTSVKSSLYIPLPGIGALYPPLRRGFSNPEDDGHPLYRNMINKIDGVFEGDPNVIHVSGHEHGLQFIKDKKRIQIVSGAGAKGAVVLKRKNALFAQRLPGYVVIDQFEDKSLHFTIYADPDSSFKPVFTYDKPFQEIRIPVKKIEQTVYGDSITVAARPDFDKVGKLHKLFYGENYRKEWATPARLPVIRISSYKGGLTPVRFGGAHQTSSLLLKDHDGKEYILSNIQKYPLILLPAALRETFAESWLKDAMSAQHPYAAVMGPIIANAVKVKHTNPTIGWVAPDPKLGYYEKDFAGTIGIIEDREPGDSSINTGNMIKQLDKSYNNRVDSVEFLRARLLDWFLGDWDQHEDQWRWQATHRGKAKYYSAIPHDRAATFFISQGIIPKIASGQYVARYLKGYDAGSHTINGFYLNDHTLNTRFMTQISYNQWMSIARNFASSLTDSVLEASLRRLPLSIYKIRHHRLLKQMQKRRDNLVKAAETYYRFFNRRVDIKATDETEYFSVKDTLQGSLVVRVNKQRNHTPSGVLFSRVFDPAITKEIRIYISKGNDTVIVDNKTSPIKIRFIGGVGHKLYDFESGNRKVNVYEKLNSATFTGPDASKVDKHLSNDTTNVTYIATNLYHTFIPLLKTGYNADQGYYLDGGFHFIHEGFRKQPNSFQEVTIGHSFANESSRLNYTGSWVNSIDKADAEVQGNVYFPRAINFFGRGNSTPYDKEQLGANYYRYKFTFLTTDATLRFQNLAGNTSLKIGPSFQYYHYTPDDETHLVDHSPLIHSYDSATVAKDKYHLGLVVTYTDDKRNNKMLTSWGVYVNVRLQAYAGLGSYSKSFVQVIPEAILYESFDTNSKYVLSERLGGGLTAGKTASYQSLFLGGEANLPGFKEERFAGQHMMYNNLELRIKLGNLASYILPGQFGVTGFHAIGRVWEKNEDSGSWHNSFGGGIYFAPANMALLQIKGAFSSDGFYPYVNFNLTF
jgi:hypothetical protein